MYVCGGVREGERWARARTNFWTTRELIELLYDSPIKSESGALPGKVILKMGIFPRIPEPETENFALHRHPWQPNLEGTVKHTLTRNSRILDE